MNGYKVNSHKHTYLFTRPDWIILYGSFYNTLFFLVTWTFNDWTEPSQDIPKSCGFGMTREWVNDNTIVLCELSILTMMIYLWLFQTVKWWQFSGISVLHWWSPLNPFCWWLLMLKLFVFQLFQHNQVSCYTVICLYRQQESTKMWPAPSASLLTLVGVTDPQSLCRITFRGWRSTAPNSSSSPGRLLHLRRETAL